MGKKRKRESPKEDEDARENGSGDGEAKDETEDYFFDVRKDLKELFNSVESGGGEFSFLARESTEDNQQEEALKDSSSLKEKEFTVVQQQQQKDEHTESVKYFFFHSDNDTLRNRLDENDFVRTRSIAELSADWPDKRTAMKNSFRKRKKESFKTKKRKWIALPSDV